MTQKINEIQHKILKKIIKNKSWVKQEKKLQDEIRDYIDDKVSYHDDEERGYLYDLLLHSLIDEVIEVLNDGYE